MKDYSSALFRVFSNCSLLTISFVILTHTVVYGQSIDLSATPETAEHAPNVFQLKDRSVLLRENVIQFRASGAQLSQFTVYGISPDRSVIGLLQEGLVEPQGTVINTAVDTINSFAPSQLPSDDPSLAIYPFADGRTVIRQNIGRFTVYNPLGEVENRYSTVVGTEGGEAISKLAASRKGETIVLYTPKIIRGGQKGSRAHIAQPDGSLNTIYRSLERQIREVRIADGGNFIGLLTAKEGADSRILVFDRYGNLVRKLRFEKPVEGFSVSADGHSLVAYSSSRATAFNLITGEEQQGVAFQSNVVYAEYFPSDQMILALSGNKEQEGRRLTVVAFHAVDLAKADITSVEWSGSLGLHPQLELRFERTGERSYVLKGTSQEISVQPEF